MKQISSDKKCFTCLGCNRLELEDFNGIYRCQNYMKGAKDGNCKNNNKNSNANICSVCSFMFRDSNLYKFNKKGENR